MGLQRARHDLATEQQKLIFNQENGLVPKWAEWELLKFFRRDGRVVSDATEAKEQI